MREISGSILCIKIGQPELITLKMSKKKEMLIFFFENLPPQNKVRCLTPYKWNL